MKDWCRVKAERKLPDAVCVVSYHNLLGLCNKARQKVSLSQAKLPVCICLAEKCQAGVRGGLPSRGTLVILHWRFAFCSVGGFRGKTQPGMGTGRHAAAAEGSVSAGTAAAGQLEVVRPWSWKNGYLPGCNANTAHVNRGVGCREQYASVLLMQIKLPYSGTEIA